MGLINTIKNALFEVEYVEVEDTPKKEKKVKTKEKNKDVEDKPIAKKIVLPGRKHEKVEEIKEEELKNDNFEARPIDETIKEEKHEEFKFMDDNDFRVDEFTPTEQPQIVEVIGSDNHDVVNHLSRQEKNKNLDVANGLYDEVRTSVTSEETPVLNDDKVIDSVGDNSIYKVPERQSRPYGMDSSYNVSVHQYGSYDRKEEKSVFRPSPIISPIYGILDKNYKKEDVVQKKEIRLSSYTRSNMNVDDIRNKAYGKNKEEEEKKVEENPKKFEVEEQDENLLVDLSKDTDRPEVKELTMGDAMEYFQDLGLEYNVDYVDASSGKTAKRDSTGDEDLEEDLKKEIEKENEDKPIEVIQPKEDRVEIATEVSSEIPEIIPEKTNVVEIKDEAKDKNAVSLEDDDNLFDLIDSMYKEDN